MICLQAAGLLQLCAGQLAGCESASYPMWKVFDSPNTEGIPHVDATNAFNCLDRQTALKAYPSSILPLPEF